ncbi:hypothetical protein H4582DRAFT_2075503 [Lactarius indigo]|nr:hypothetical protein H4582DRAFT_2075503 [Lactarius indigo]
MLCCLCLTRTTRPGPRQLVEEEVRWCEAEDEQLVFVSNKTVDSDEVDVRATDPEADEERRERP